MSDQERPGGPYGHLCWAYDDPAEFHARAEQFLRAGLTAGRRVWFVTPDRPEPVLERLHAAPGFTDALRDGAAEVIALGSAYATDAVVDHTNQVAAYLLATREALAAGYSGLRVVADATPLVRTPARRDAFARYEHRIDRAMRQEPFEAMCAYRRAELGDRAVAELACLHPQHNVESLLFRLYAAPPGQGHATLAGELDLTTHQLFRTTLERADLEPTDGELVLHAADLHFLDHRSLVHLREYARRRGATAVLRTSHAAAARLAALLDLPGLRVELVR
ncbi:MEDS: MEthanogen/methylotroph, DcmR Sensory domain [Micromonospora nigra]|uniref:MEDS: MEthanogen/methylotroph, DcmR Sensory domain n=1 Tax=Micromonospora nigra TaxID=145857 RepID=A0A1C6S6X7_9ACTN|nr:MEDS domain-containing protein [Micromonospora nigra]SCL25229.1 MEDS: MEthanogen/methylotroph, DcmR Sensory domain [Micromonospora nigra]